MNLAKIICAVFGHRMQPTPDESGHVSLAWYWPSECSRCGCKWRGYELLSAPPMPTCKPPKEERSEIGAITAQVAKLELNAGDTLAVMVKDHLSSEQAKNMREYLRLALPVGVKTMVLDGGISIAKIGATEAQVTKQTSFSDCD